MGLIARYLIRLSLISYEMDSLAYGKQDPDPDIISSEDEGSKTLDNLSNRTCNRGS